MYRLLVVFCLLCSFLKAQPQHILDLEEQVYNLNNALKYTESQKLLQNFLDQSNRTDEDRFYANLFFSHTYKRLYDYDNVLKYLDKALNCGIETSEKEYFISNIQCQKALVYFDIQKYQKADSLMQILSKNKYQHLNTEYQSKIMMQEAYLLYLNKIYTQAEKKYDQAIELLRGSSPCDLPMIYTKKMELYQAMGNQKKIDQAYKSSLFYADSCKIVKYTIYTKEVFANVLINHHGMSSLMGELDSLHRVYNEKEYLKNLKDLEKKYEENIKDIALSNKQRQVFLLSIIALGLVIVLGVVAYFLWFIRKQRDIISQNNTVNEHLIDIISHDIKEPLLGVSLLLKKLVIKDTLLQQASTSLEQQISSINNLLNNLLSIKKYQKATNVLENCQVVPVVEQVIKEAKYALEVKEIFIKNAISPTTELPISAEKLQIILRNILNNAIKFSYPKGEIHFINIPQGIALKDFGTGISAENQSQLLHQVVMAGSGTLHEKGNGMGLYLIGQLIKNSEIFISFSSTSEKGTIVSVYSK